MLFGIASWFWKTSHLNHEHPNCILDQKNNPGNLIMIIISADQNQFFK